MTEESKQKKCNCSLFLGIAVLAIGVVTGIMGGVAFNLMQVLAIVVGIGLILFGVKGSHYCKCCK